MPVAGDVVSALVGLYPILIAKKHNLSKVTRLRMAANFAMDLAFGAVLPAALAYAALREALADDDVDVVGLHEILGRLVRALGTELVRSALGALQRRGGHARDLRSREPR